MVTDNIKYRFIQNIGDYFPSGYFSEDFIDKVQKASGLNSDDMNALCPPFVALRAEYEKYKNYIVNTNPRTKDAIKHTHDFHTRLLKILGYSTDSPYDRFYSVDEENNFVVPVRHILTKNGRTAMLVMEMQPLIKIGDKEPAGLFEQQYNVESKGGITEQTIRHQQYYAGQWSEVFNLPQEQHISPAVINKAIDTLFLLPEERRPHFILMMAGNIIFLLDSEKWNRGAYLEFSLDELFSQASISAFRKYYALFHLLVCKETLASDSETILMDVLVEDSYKNAYEVTKDLKEGVVLAVETLANEALYYKRNVVHEPFGKKTELKDGTIVFDETDDNFEAEVKDDCLTIIYRLLFIFYAESRTELEILPTSDDVYKQGYSLELLRDLEQTRLNSQQSRDGYFFDDSIQHLFKLLSCGYNKTDSMINNKSFRIRPIDSPLFDNNRLNHLGNIRIRNCKWQEIICALSLSKKNGKFGRGRISYANLGVNQLGSVYESLLAYRGFYAEEDYIEVHRAGKPEEGTFLVPYSRMDDFEVNEIVCDEDERPKILLRGTFVYRLNGRDRQKSASYYTPEVLTRSTVKYTLKTILDEVAEGKRKATELLELKILEPAMGAAAFQNEVINQLAEAYLTYQQQQQREKGLKNWRISPDHYRDELQKVKAYIATHNVYGVDLNPTAVELGKLSLWLNVIHKDMETPFFANRLTVGNAVIGAWLKVYSKSEIYGIKGRNKLEQNKWWERAPHKIKFYTNRVNRSVNDIYHFLLPDNNMLGVRGITDQKKANKEAFDRMTKIIKGWIAPINETDFATLKRISAKIDILLKDYFTTQISIDKYTNNRNEIWDGIDHSESISLFRETERAENYTQKQRLFDTRYGHDNAYHKLKLVMDYWCALWFWEYRDAPSLPTREEYWADIEELLDVDNEKIEAKTRQALERAKTASLFDNEDDFHRISEDDAQIVLKTQKEILTEAHANLSLFADEEPKRFKIVERLSNRYHFFHPMLEFIEVFWLRDGFDIICGNPPWIKWQYEPLNIIADKYPEYAIRGDKDADAIERLIKENNYFSDTDLKQSCEAENIECACTSDLQNSPVLYFPLKGSQSDLFKSILYNSLEMISPNGFVGMVHPPTPFIEAKGQSFRKYLYPRLRYVFQYENNLLLFSEVEAKKPYNICIYGQQQEVIEFIAMSDVFHPNMIDISLNHCGDSVCGGREVVDHEGKKILNLVGHRDRIIYYNQSMLQLIARVFENSEEWDSCKLVSVHSQNDIKLIAKLSQCGHLSSVTPFITECFHATNSKKDNTIREETKYPDYDKYEMIFNSTMVNLSSPFAKMPQAVCKKDSQYDLMDYSLWNVDNIIRTNYLPKVSIIDFKNKIDETGIWFTRYKLALKKMLDSTHERTLKGGIIPPKSSHTHSIISVSFANTDDLLIFTGLSSSIILDYFLKTVRCKNLTSSVLSEMPYGIPKKLKDSLIIRVLRLNCVNKWYAELWNNSFKPEISKELWSSTDKRLSPFSLLTKEYSANSLLRNDFERRQALLEIDVVTAMSLGLTFEDLIYIYKSTFGTTQKYEADTWYDINGRIIFSPNNSPIKRNIWEKIKSMKPGETYEHTLTSELYNGQTIIYEAPFTKCDRVEDYRIAWAHFEKRFNKR